MPNNWKTYKLEDIASFSYGKMPKKNLLNTGQYPTFSGYKYQYQYPEFNVFKGDLIVVARGVGGTGDVKLVKEKSYLTNLSIKIELNQNILTNEYFYYKFFINNLKYLDSGSAQSQLTINDLSKVDVKIPPLPEQKAIASILSAIDDKIENNLAINNTLEEMAMALYKHWFVDFGPFQEGEFINSELGPIPKGWEVKRLDEVAFKNSKTFNFKGKDKVVFVNTGDVQNGSFLHDNYSAIEGLPGQAKKIIEPNDILYSEIRPKNRRFAYVDFDSSEYVVSTKFMIIRNNEKINNRLLYRVLTRQDTIDEFQMIAESRSGTFPQITFDVIGHFPIALPNIDLQNKFQDLVEPFEQRQANSLKENQNLIKLRNTLLPKLISGEVRLKEFQEQIETVL